MISVSDRVENITEKRENACYHHFLLSYNIFKAFFSVVKSRVLLVKS